MRKEDLEAEGYRKLHGVYLYSYNGKGFEEQYGNLYHKDPLMYDDRMYPGGTYFLPKQFEDYGLHDAVECSNREGHLYLGALWLRRPKPGYAIKKITKAQVTSAVNGFMCIV